MTKTNYTTLFLRTDFVQRAASQHETEFLRRKFLKFWTRGYFVMVFFTEPRQQTNLQSRIPNPRHQQQQLKEPAVLLTLTACMQYFWKNVSNSRQNTQTRPRRPRRARRRPRPRAGRPRSPPWRPRSSPRPPSQRSTSEEEEEGRGKKKSKKCEELHQLVCPNLYYFDLKLAGRRNKTIGEVSLCSTLQKKSG